ncbi:hypothetical protein BT69DRAFT_1356244 [Atractiella rhizophila]|nr:hypothetical protein BT69DRAFT_1356244 [Atractiella rhizophila]
MSTSTRPKRRRFESNTSTRAASAEVVDPAEHARSNVGLGKGKTVEGTALPGVITENPVRDAAVAEDAIMKEIDDHNRIWEGLMENHSDSINDLPLEVRRCFVLLADLENKRHLAHETLKHNLLRLAQFLEIRKATDPARKEPFSFDEVLDLPDLKGITTAMNNALSLLNTAAQGGNITVGGVALTNVNNSDSPAVLIDAAPSVPQLDEVPHRASSPGGTSHTSLDFVRVEHRPNVPIQGQHKGDQVTQQDFQDGRSENETSPQQVLQPPLTDQQVTQEDEDRGEPASTVQEKLSSLSRDTCVESKPEEAGPSPTVGAPASDPALPAEQPVQPSDSGLLIPSARVQDKSPSPASATYAPFSVMPVPNPYDTFHPPSEETLRSILQSIARSSRGLVRCTEEKITMEKGLREIVERSLQRLGDDIERMGTGRPPRNSVTSSSRKKQKKTATTTSDAHPDGADDVLYCHCRRPSFGNMVACDGQDCEIEWYHLSCVNLDKGPQGLWYCDICSAKQEGGRTSKKRRKGS